MIAPTTIADTSVWIDHINGKDTRLSYLLREQRILLHPMIVGEIALGSIRDRHRVLADLRGMPCAPSVAHDEVLALIETLELCARGIGYVDAHLLASVLRVRDGTILTSDKRLLAQAERLGIDA